MFPAFLGSFQYDPFSNYKFEYNICTSINPYNKLIQTLRRFDLLFCHSTKSSRTPPASYDPPSFLEYLLQMMNESGGVNQTSSSFRTGSISWVAKPTKSSYPSAPIIFCTFIFKFKTKNIHLL